jgi:hypothetical protein
MYYYFYENMVTTSEVAIAGLTELTTEQIEFYELHKPNVSVQEVLNCELNPVPEPEPYVPIPTEQERIEALEDVVNLIIAGEL